MCLSLGVSMLEDKIWKVPDSPANSHPYYGFLCPVNFPKEKYIRVKKKKLFEKNMRENYFRYLWIIRHTSHLTNIIPIPICKFWNSQTIPIPIRTEVGSTNLFLFLFAGKITIRWSLLFISWDNVRDHQQLGLVIWAITSRDDKRDLSRRHLFVLRLQ